MRFGEFHEAGNTSKNCDVKIIAYDGDHCDTSGKVVPYRTNPQFFKKKLKLARYLAALLDYALPLGREPHSAVRDTHIEKLVPIRLEAQPLVETDGMNLRFQVQLLHRRRVVGADVGCSMLHERVADPLLPKLCQCGHPLELSPSAIVQKSNTSRCGRHTVLACQEVDCSRGRCIEFIDFITFRNFLLLDEHPLSNFQCFPKLILRYDDLDLHRHFGS